MPADLPAAGIECVQAIMFCRYDDLPVHHERLGIDCSVQRLSPETRKVSGIRYARNKAGASIVLVVHAPVGTGQLVGYGRCGRERERRDLHRLRWRNGQRTQELVKLVTLLVEYASEQDRDDKRYCQGDTPVLREAVSAFICWAQIVRFSHHYHHPCRLQNPGEPHCLTGRTISQEG